MARGVVVCAGIITVRVNGEVDTCEEGETCSFEQAAEPSDLREHWKETLANCPTFEKYFVEKCPTTSVKCIPQMMSAVEAKAIRTEFATVSECENNEAAAALLDFCPKYAWKVFRPSCSCGQPETKQKGRVACYGTATMTDEPFEADENECEGGKPEVPEQTCPANQPCREKLARAHTYMHFSTVLYFIVFTDEGVCSDLLKSPCTLS